MQFINPSYLFGLFAIAIPVIIHLFNFRRFRRVYFTNVRFIKEMKQETQKRSQLRHLIILALRILAITALVLAFAQPYIPFKENKAPIAARNAVSIFVDNSFSMEAVGGNGSLLDEAKQKAKEIVAAYKPSDYFQLLTNDFEGRHQRLITADEFMTLLEEVKPSPSSRKLPEILSRQFDMLSSSQSSRRTSFIISDFQKSSFHSAGSLRDTSVSTFLLPVKANSPGNVYIDSCWFDLPLQQAGHGAILNARVWNKSETDLEKIPVRLEINGSQKAVASVDLRAGSSVEVRMPFTNNKPGIQQGVAEVTDYPVTYDDRFYFSFEVTSSLTVLCINGKDENRYIKALYAQDSAIVLRNLPEKSLDYGNLSSFNLIILNELPAISTGLAQELKRFTDNGGSIAIVPASNPDLASYNSFLSSVQCPAYQPLDTADSRIVKLSTESPVFGDVFEKTPGSGEGLPENTELPRVFKHFPIAQSTLSLTHSLMKMLNGRDFLTLTNSSLGQVIQFSVPLDPAFSNFPRKALFVPVLYNLALISRPPLKLYYTAGQNEAIRINHLAPEADKVFRIKSLKGDFEFIPEHHRLGPVTNVFVNNQLSRAGNYMLYLDKQAISGLSFNYNRDESDPACLSQEGIEKMISQSHLPNFTILKTGHKTVNEVLHDMNYGTQLWKYFVWMVLLFLLGEVSLLRFWKY